MIEDSDWIERKIRPINDELFNADELKRLVIERDHECKILTIWDDKTPMMVITHDGENFHIQLNKGDWVVSGDI